MMAPTLEDSVIWEYLVRPEMVIVKHRLLQRLVISATALCFWGGDTAQALLLVA